MFPVRFDSRHIGRIGEKNGARFSPSPAVKVVEVLVAHSGDDFVKYADIAIVLHDLEVFIEQDE